MRPKPSLLTASQCAWSAARAATSASSERSRSGYAPVFGSSSALVSAAHTASPSRSGRTRLRSRRFSAGTAASESPSSSGYTTGSVGRQTSFSTTMWRPNTTSLAQSGRPAFLGVDEGRTWIRLRRRRPSPHPRCPPRQASRGGCEWTMWPSREQDEGWPANERDPDAALALATAFDASSEPLPAPERLSRLITSSAARRAPCAAPASD